MFATASLDGHVKFWRVSYEETEYVASSDEAKDVSLSLCVSSPNAVHDFVPHDGEPVSCLFFTDNHLVKDRK